MDSVAVSAGFPLGVNGFVSGAIRSASDLAPVPTQVVAGTPNTEDGPQKTRMRSFTASSVA